MKVATHSTTIQPSNHPTPTSVGHFLPNWKQTKPPIWFLTDSPFNLSFPPAIAAQHSRSCHPSLCFPSPPLLSTEYRTRVLTPRAFPFLPPPSSHLHHHHHPSAPCLAHLSPSPTCGSAPECGKLMTKGLHAPQKLFRTPRR